MIRNPYYTYLNKLGCGGGGIYGGLITPSIAESLTGSPQYCADVNRAAIDRRAIPRLVNFNPNVQEINGLRFVLAENTAKNVNLMLSSIPAVEDQIHLLGVDLPIDRIGNIFSISLRKAVDTISDPRMALDQLVYFIYDGDRYIGFVIMEFFTSDSREVQRIEGKFTRQSGELYSDIIGVPHSVVNIAIAIHPDFRRLGYGLRILGGLIGIICTQTNTVVAYYVASHTNFSSVALARRAGLPEVETTDPTKGIFINICRR